jgi:fumarylacetoacetase
MADLNETHDPARRSWVEAANKPDCDFPIQNLPFGVFQSPGRAPRGGVAIGDLIVDLKAVLDAGLFLPSVQAAARAASEPTLNTLMAMPPRQISALRHALSEMLRSDGPDRPRVEKMAGGLLVPMHQASFLRPSAIGGFTDFFTSLDHVTRVGRILRPDSELPPAFKHLPMAYNGRASSVVIGDTPVMRPHGQRMRGNGEVEFAPTRSLDYELEAGIYIGAGNALGLPIPLSAAPEHIFGLCLLNDWSARDIQRWESFPLGPFLGKSFCTTISPWIVTAEALAPFRVPVVRTKDDPVAQAYLQDAIDREEGAFDIELSATIQTAAMRSKGQTPTRITLTNLKTLYWTAAQMIAHHTSNGCSLQPGDLLGTGTTSGPTDESRACMLELTAGGKQPLALPGGETRAWLEDGDEVAFHARARRDGFVPIGFGACRARIAPASSA